MSAETSDCPRCRLHQGEVALLRSEIAGLRDSVLTLTRRLTDVAPALEIVCMDEPERLALAGPYGTAPDQYYRVTLTYRDQLSATCLLPIDDPAAFLEFFEGLARQKSGWDGEKKIACREGQLSITCTYEGKRYRPSVSMDVFCALDVPSFDPYWRVQLHLDVAPDALGGVAAGARAVFATTAAETRPATDGDSA